MTTPAPFNDILAFDNMLDTYIEFPTRSDAMLASLGLFHGVDCKIMDAVFNILQNPAFDPAELTFRGTEDIYLHVAKWRCQETSFLPQRGFRELSTFNVFPELILENIIEILGDELEQVSRAFASSMPREPDRDTKKVSAIRRDLSSMSLVQRSWLRPARRALGRCLELINPSQDTLMRTLRQPFFGPWTRHIAIVALKGDNTTRLVRPLQRLLSERLTSVLSMSLTIRRPDADVITGIFQFLPLVKDLRLEVCPTGREVSAVHQTFFSAFASLSHLEHLVLTLHKWYPTCLPSDRLPNDFAFAVLLSHMCTLHVFGRNDAEYVSWARAANGSFYLRSLDKDLARKGHSIRSGPLSSVEATIPLLENVTELRLRVPDSGHSTLPRLLPHSRELQRLHVEADEFPSLAALKSIPASVRSLTFQFSIDFRKYPDAEHEPWPRFDSRLVSYLVSDQVKALQSLRMRMHPQNEGFLVHTKRGYRFRVMENIKLARSENVCRDRNIEWEFAHLAGRSQGY